MKRTTFVAVFAAHLVAACGTTPDPEIEIQTREVLVPVALSCVPASLPAAPAYTVSKADVAAAPTPEVRLQLLAVYALERTARLAEVEPVIAGCR